MRTPCTAATICRGGATGGGGGGGEGGGAGPALAGPILILSLKKNIYISFLNPKEVAVYVHIYLTLITLILSTRE